MSRVYTDSIYACTCLRRKIRIESRSGVDQVRAKEAVRVPSLAQLLKPREVLVREEAIRALCEVGVAEVDPALPFGGDCADALVHPRAVALVVGGIAPDRIGRDVDVALHR